MVETLQLVDYSQSKFLNKVRLLAEKSVRLKRLTNNFEAQELLKLEDLLFYDPSPNFLQFPVQYLLTYDEKLGQLTDDRRLRALLRPKLGELITFFNESSGHEKILGYLITLFPFKELRQFSIPNLKEIMDTHEIELISRKSEWWLCETSEDRLIESLINNKVLMLNDKLLLKFIGKITAYCLEDFTNAEGFLFRKGYWYSPADNNIKRQFIETFRTGATQTDLIESSWVYMRPSSQYIDDVVSILDKQNNSEATIKRANLLKEIFNNLFVGKEESSKVESKTTFHEAIEYYLSQLSSIDPDLEGREQILAKRGETDSKV